MSGNKGTSRPATSADYAVPAVWDLLHRAVFFIWEAEDPELDLPVTWCWQIAAESLWSAVDIFIKKIAEPSAGQPRSATAWFTESTEDNARALVRGLRTSTVHFEVPSKDWPQPHGFGMASGGGDEPQRFLWLGPPGKHEEIPTEEVPKLLSNVAEQVGLLLVRETGEIVIGPLVRGRNLSKWDGDLSKKHHLQRDKP